MTKTCILEKKFLEHFFFLDEGQPEEDSDGADSNEEELDEKELTELQNETDIEHFNAIFAQAQVMAVKAEVRLQVKSQSINPTVSPCSKASRACCNRPKTHQHNVATFVNHVLEYHRKLNFIEQYWGAAELI